jgi:hypothetical protein
MSALQKIREATTALERYMQHRLGQCDSHVLHSLERRCW